jgi:hypothetical protein
VGKQKWRRALLFSQGFNRLVSVQSCRGASSWTCMSVTTGYLKAEAQGSTETYWHYPFVIHFENPRLEEPFCSHCWCLMPRSKSREPRSTEQTVLPSGTKVEVSRSPTPLRGRSRSKDRRTTSSSPAMARIDVMVEAIHRFDTRNLYASGTRLSEGSPHFRGMSSLFH